MIAIKKDPDLWAKLKKQIQGDKKQWNARLGQQLSKLYKKEGGEYVSPKSQTSLNKWTKQNWQYIGDSKRYLPEKVIKNLTEKEKKEAIKGKKLGEKKKYPESLVKKMKSLGILKK